MGYLVLTHAPGRAAEAFEAMVADLTTQSEWTLALKAYALAVFVSGGAPPLVTPIIGLAGVGGVLVGRAFEFVSPQSRHSGAALKISTRQNVAQHAADKVRMLVGLIEQSRDNTRTEAPRAAMCNITASQQAQEVRLARPVASKNRNTFTEPDVQIERKRQVGQLQLLADDDLLTGPPAGQPHVDVLIAGRLGRPTGLIEMA